MSKISEYLTQIKTAIYGREVRDAIHDSIEQCYTDVSNAKTLADTAASNANAATRKENTAASNADAKAKLANDAATKAGTATSNANAATTKANNAATKANTAASNADTATSNANAATTKANNAASKADTATNNANTATTKANEATSKANTAASNADTATSNANAATSKANTAAETVQTKLNNNDFVPNITFTVKTGLPGTNVAVEQTGTGKSIVLKLTIPRGDTGSLENIDEVLDTEFRNRDIVPLTNELIDSAIASAEGE